MKCKNNHSKQGENNSNTKQQQIQNKTKGEEDSNGMRYVFEKNRLAAQGDIFNN